MQMQILRLSNRYEDLPSVQVEGNTDPEQRIPSAFQEQHEVCIHRSDPEVEGQDLVQHRVSNVHNDRVHPTPDKWSAAPDTFQVDEQEAQR